MKTTRRSFLQSAVGLAALWKTQGALGKNLAATASSRLTGEVVRSRVGVYGWGQLPASLDPYVTFTGDTGNLGARAVRIVAANGYWDPRGQQEPLPLDQLVQRSDYAAVFKSFDTVVVTAFPLSGRDAEKGVPIYRERALTVKETDAIHAEGWQLGFALGFYYPDVNACIGNWESEHDACQDSMWGSFLSAQKAFAYGLKDGYAAARAWRMSDGLPEGRGSLRVMFEFSNITEDSSPKGSLGEGISGLRRALADEEFRGLVDLWSYSSWNSVRYPYQMAVSEAGDFFRSEIERIRATFAEFGVDCSERLMIGELGTLRTHDPDSALLATLNRVALEENIQLVMGWVAYDQPGSGVLVEGQFYEQSQFGKFTLDGTLTSQGEAFRTWLNNGFSVEPVATATSSSTGKVTVRTAMSARSGTMQPVVPALWVKAPGIAPLPVH